MSDLELLQHYTRSNCQEAFATLVERHLNLVYSAARRQVRSPQLAEEIAQSVFIDLARHAANLTPEQPLVAWLFLVTRRTAIDVIRRESRRAAREQTAAELSAAMETPSPSWNQMKDVLDDAIADLDGPDRTALLLRFFENRSLREVGASLGTSEDTAQKRVSRALDRLRTVFARRGIAVAATTLATDLSAHAIEAAPASLTATLTSTSFIASGSALAPAPAALASAPTTSWTTLQKIAAAVATAGVLGFIAVEASAYARQRAELATLTERTTRLDATLTALRAEHSAVASRVPAARATLAEASRPRVVDAELEAAIAAWLARVKRLQELAAQRPDLGIPELAFLTERDWFSAAKEAKLETEPGIHEAFQTLRQSARESLADTLDRALDRYVAAHDGDLPDSPQQLAAYSTPPLPSALLEDYEMLQRGLLQAVPKDAWLIAERPAAAARHGNRVFVSAEKSGTESLSTATTSAP